MKQALISFGLAGAVIGFLTRGHSAPSPAAQPTPPLLAHWTFDEPAGTPCRDQSGRGSDVLPDQAVPSVGRTRGIHNSALSLRGTHALRARFHFTNRELAALTFSAWTRPVELPSFREIFRQECPNRLLFSFQENGTILSLGLNIGGYIECDAPIQPAQVLDGLWHHCAATFDGAWMRVYLDGREIGSLKRPGKIAVSTDAPAFIGSLGGTGEHFQGALDDLRIYEGALTAEQVAALHRAGIESQRRLAAELDLALQPIYSPGRTFAETLAASRKKLVEHGGKLEAELAGAIQAKLKVSFPADCENFVTWTGLAPAEFLTSRDTSVCAKVAARFVDLLLEYKPLTENQWKKQTPQARRKWAEADKIKQRFDALLARGDEARFSEDWIKTILEAGPHIQFRPVRHEAVAPFVKPETPATRSLTTDEARAALERDWLHQADGKPTLERIKNEIRWARELACRILATRAGKVDFSGELPELDRIERRLHDSVAGDVSPRHSPRIAPTHGGGYDKLYFAVRAAKRAIAFKNPLLDFDKLLFVDMPFPQGSEWQHETRHRLGYMAVPGARLLTLEGLRPDGKLTQLMPQAPLHGSFWRPDVSFDAKRVVFCFKPHNEKSFHLYEINADGSGLRQLTDGMFDDLDPIYLPDGHILFTTTRGHTYVRCMPPTSAFVLARCDRDGRNVYLISGNNEPDYLPSVLNDGRVIYTRWEYTDKPLWRAQKLWTVHPDGTQVLMFWGNQSVWPDVMKDARAIPGSRRVMFTGSAHHNWFAGSVGLIDPEQGFNFPWGLTKITADTAWPECGNGPVDPAESPRYHASGKFAGYYSPYPLSEQDFLVSANRGGKFVLYLMDVDGNRELIYEGTHNVFDAMPLKPRPTPPVIQDRVTWPALAEREQPQHGVIFSGDVFQGVPELRGKAKLLRVFSIDPKTYTYWYKRPYISTGPVVSAVQSEGVKRLLGTVPIEADGSVSFHAPAGVALHFQLLDEHQRALQTMRSFVNVMPGEKRGCLGCHESHSRSSEVRGTSLALTRPPRDITPPSWSDDTVSYPRYVQPVLDKYCGKCHQGDGEGRKTLDLTERPSAPIFTEPYLTLIGRPTWGEPYRAPEKPPPGFGIAGMLMVEGYGQIDPKGYATPPPMTALSYRSKLIELASSGRHHAVKVDDLSLLRLIVWVDAMCPYKGDEEVRAEADPIFQGVDWLAVRPKVATAPRIVRPGPVE